MAIFTFIMVKKKMKKKILLEDFLNLMTVLLSDFWYLEGYE